MSTPRLSSPVTALLAAGLAVTLSFGLSGCFANPFDGLIEGAVRGGIENAVKEGLEQANKSGLDELVKEALSGDGTAQNNDERGGTGSDSPGGSASIPDNFPAEIPLAQGTVIKGESVEVQGVRGWSIVIEVDDVGAAIDQAIDDIPAAGFERISKLEHDGAFQLSFMSDKYLIGLMGTKGSKDKRLYYTVNALG